MGWLEPAQHRRIPPSSLNQTPFADAENEHPPPSLVMQHSRVQGFPAKPIHPPFLSCSTDSCFSAVETRIHDGIVDALSISEQPCTRAPP